MTLEPALYIVATPIGNLRDITLRALDILKDVDVIAAEDTRVAGMLLKHLDLPKKQMISYHDFSETDKSNVISSLILSGKSVALTSDAGSPCISDPGFRLINVCINNGIKVVPIPGANALIPALQASGLPTDRFTFLGFPPAKKGRQTFIKSLIGFGSTIIIYESPHKIIRLFEELNEIYGDIAFVSFSREITKFHEEHFRGTPNECLEYLNAKAAIKGEFVIVVSFLKK